MAENDKAPLLGLHHAAVDAAVIKGTLTNSTTQQPHLRTAPPCPKCGVIATPQIAPGNGPHAFRANCAHCGSFVQWLSKYPPAEREARRQHYRQQALAQKPASPRQLACLQALGDAGPPPENMAEASERIGNLKRGRVA